jgi:hypothetical protein
VNGYGQRFFSATLIQMDTWYHAAGTYDFATGTAMLYLDGELQMQGPLTSTKDFTALPLSIGARPDGRECFQRAIDDARVYDTALSMAEIADIMAGTDRNVVTVQATDGTVNESGDTGTFTISRTGFTWGALTVNLSTGGTAEAGDYTTNPDISGGSAVIADGQSSVAITVTPQQDADLDDAGTYYWHVTAQNSGGDTDASNNDATFDTLPDTTAPWVISTGPSPGEDGADVGTTIRINFSEPVTVPDLNTAVQVSGGVTGNAEVLPGDRAVVFTPDADLDYDTTYTVTVASAIADNANDLNPLDGNKGALTNSEFSFTTFEELSGYATGTGCTPGAGAGVALALAAAGTLALARMGRRR